MRPGSSVVSGTWRGPGNQTGSGPLNEAIEGNINAFNALAPYIAGAKPKEPSVVIEHADNRTQVLGTPDWMLDPTFIAQRNQRRQEIGLEPIGLSEGPVIDGVAIEHPNRSTKGSGH